MSFMVRSSVSHQRALQASLDEAEARGAAAGGAEEGAGGGSHESPGLEELREELQRRGQRLQEVQEERDTLLSELEELDHQNQEATQVRTLHTLTLSWNPTAEQIWLT